ncbi:MAG: DUF2147 domain-containing protein [Rudaea sp.]
MRSVILSIALLLYTCAADAANDTPVGRWMTIDDETHAPSAIVDIIDEPGGLSGHIVSLFPKPGREPAPLCKNCSGERKDQPVIGMKILWGLHRDGDEWNGGEIFDPDGGTTYRCKIRVIDDGEKLDVRGFVGISLLGRTQTWVRQKPDVPPANP